MDTAVCWKVRGQVCCHFLYSHVRHHHELDCRSNVVGWGHFSPPQVTEQLLLYWRHHKDQTALTLTYLLLFGRDVILV